MTSGSLPHSLAEVTSGCLCLLRSLRVSLALGKVEKEQWDILFGAGPEARPWFLLKWPMLCFSPSLGTSLAPGWALPDSTVGAGRQCSLGLALGQLALDHCFLMRNSPCPLCPRLPPAVPHPHCRQCQPTPPHSMVLPTLHLCTGCEGKHSLSLVPDSLA